MGNHPRLSFPRPQGDERRPLTQGQFWGRIRRFRMCGFRGNFMRIVKEPAKALAVKYLLVDRFLVLRQTLVSPLS
jgi:hypothetical protein